jgi:NitT/TauT family transport system substrate-binding protein
MTGGDVIVVPTANPDQLALMQRGGVDAVWTVEPWVTRLEREAKAKVFFDETDVITTWLAASAKFLSSQRELAKKIAQANTELTQWIVEHPDEAQKMLIAELKEETRADFAPEVIAQAWKRIKLSSEIPRNLVDKAVKDATDVGFLKGNTDTSKLIDIP